MEGKKYIVQGFGNVGYWVSHFLAKEGAILVGVQDAFGTIFNNKGINVEDLQNYVLQNNGSVKDYSNAVEIANEDFYALDCDICIPAALGNQITEENAHKIKAFLVAEGANGPTSVEAEKILLSNGITVIPDILCNSGGVIGSYFEWLQNRHGEVWQLDEILVKLEKKIKEAFTKVLSTAQQRKVDMRTAAYIIAIERIEQAYIQRGIFP